ncbi:helix-turn-helix transcriptional regulator [Streptomyces sp. BA2]|uniref:helix-turn-helix transcriptional regulator n=1 Tax=Streptomyces sp. BA2 TaxID=436595 RepID=UPI0013293875|nr:helix-turn-helix transcriptional regulator [Streptomyces sp. BA2]MWA10996.1 helix-turn-helix domain-containing protein [Streptomyces sp. BA2]
MDTAPADPVGTAPAAAVGTATPTQPDRIRRSELADFLRSRRERITPEQAGLPRGPRRRTPGLRREEVAHLSTVGVTWYTWLEQGRAIHVSAQVLDALCRALMLDAGERAHLFQLAGTADPSPAAETASVPQGLLRIVTQLEPFPACVQNARYDVLAYNATYANLLTDLDVLPPEDRNCMWLTFTHPAWQAAMEDREETMRRMVARFRARMAGHLADPAWKTLLRRMRKASPEFCELWERHEVMQAVDQSKRFNNSLVGPLHFTYHGLWLGPAEGPRLGTYVPADARSQAATEELYRLVKAGRVGSRADTRVGSRADGGQ